MTELDDTRVVGREVDLDEQVRAATALLEALAGDRSLLEQLPEAERRRLLDAAANVFAPDVEARRQQTKARRRREKEERRRQEAEVLTETGIRQLRARPVFTTPNVFPPNDLEQLDVDEPEFREIVEPQHCYVCKQKYDLVHSFYDQLCPPCAEFNFAKRTETADLRGRVALLTGGRVKIGYQAGIKLLRAGASLIVTTRFPRDAALRYAAEADFDEWGDRLEVYGLDLRHTPSVEAFCAHLMATRHRLDYIVNNACQTVRRPAAFYEHMLDVETAALDRLQPGARAVLGGHDGLRGVELVGGDLPAVVAGP
ncbi:MAG: SDR family NAD(P)-dependent oxidoreductase, partial [Actinomycetota bacterium]|nr:SDR family NAD(P)-dependent oxidoreductase [Actinomycetota bacterium]